MNSHAKNIGIEVLRGLAALWVLIFHTFAMVKDLKRPEFLGPVVDNGAQGVTIFFVLSAFTLAMSAENRSTEQSPWRSYFLRRAFRILPLYYFMLIVFYVTSLYGHTKSHLGSDWLLSIAALFNFFPGKEEGIVWASWSIGVEILFYVTFPLVFRFCANPWAAWRTFAVFATLSFFWNRTIEAKLGHLDPEIVMRYAYMSLPTQLPVFLCGIAVFKSLQSLKVFFAESPKDKATAITAMAVATYMVFLSSTWGIRHELVLYMKSVVIGALIIGLAMHVPRPLTSRLLRHWGKVSYSLYLVHPLTIYYSQDLLKWINSQVSSGTLSFLAITTTVVTLSTIIATATYHLIEEPGQELGRKLIKRFSKGEPPTPKAINEQELKLQSGNAFRG